MAENPVPTVSVCMITYNHEPYIAQAIEGVLMQETGFPFELVIGEDCSTDRTRKIALSYQGDFQDKIRLIERNANIGMIRNFADTLRQCRGKYIALCEGDDYWTDSKKLAKQIAFLEENPDFAVCFHKVRLLKGESVVDGFLPDIRPLEVTGFDDLANNNYIPTLSCVFRNKPFSNFPDWFFECPVGDYPLHLMNAMHGKLRYLDDVMGVYRLHDGGAWSSAGREDQLRKWLTVLHLCSTHFCSSSTVGFNRQRAKTLTDLSFLTYSNREYAKFRALYREVLKHRRFLRIRTFFSVTIRFVLSYFPFLAEKITRWRTDNTQYNN